MIKINELSTDKTLDLICDLTPWVSEIMEDKEVVKLFAEKVKLDKNASEEKVKNTVITATIKKVSGLVPALLKKHREAIYNILSLLNEKSVEEIREQKALITINEIKAMLSDNDLMDFFSQLK